MTIISNKHKIIFIHIPKNAGSSIEDLILKNDRNYILNKSTSFLFNRLKKHFHIKLTYQYIYYYKLYSVDKYNSRHLNIGISLLSGHATYFDILNSLPQYICENYKAFCIIRNPFDRMASGYMYHQYDPQIKKMDFKEYILRYHEKFSQLRYISVNKDLNNNINLVRFENLDNNLDEFFKTNGVIIDVNLLKRMNKSNNYSYKSIYNTETKNLVKKIFSKELELFSYEY